MDALGVLSHDCMISGTCSLFLSVWQEVKWALKGKLFPFASFTPARPLLFAKSCLSRWGCCFGSPSSLNNGVGILFTVACRKLGTGAVLTKVSNEAWAAAFCIGGTLVTREGSEFAAASAKAWAWIASHWGTTAVAESVFLLSAEYGQIHYFPQSVWESVD